jgi:hypothetical protein
MDIEKVFADMAARWPSSIVAREQSGQFSGGSVTPRYMANLDSRGEGPKDRIRIGRKVAYPVDSFIEWLNERSHPLKKKTPKADREVIA